MSEPKTQCAACGALILQRTADGHDGLCVPCHRKAAAIPPDGFQIPRDLAQRLVSIEEDPMEYREMAWRDGAESVHRFIDKLQEQNSLYYEWSPRLREFAKKCREVNPQPTDESLSSRDRAKQQICESKIAKALRTPRGRNSVTICSMPLVAIPVAQRLWPGDDESVIHLTPEEMSEWDEIYSHPQESFWWFDHYWWSIDESPQQRLWARRRAIRDGGGNDLPDGHSPWLVTWGGTSSPLGGWSFTELWSWDGTNCMLIKSMWHDQT